jgi:hypothetical protein
MDLIKTIDMTISDVATTVDHNAALIAERTPAPLDALVRRMGAINAESVRQSGRVSVTTIEAFKNVATVTWTGVYQIADATGDAAGASAETIRTTGRRAVGDVKQATSTVKNRAANAADDVQRNFSVVADQADRVGDRIEDEAEDAAEDVVKATDAAAAETSARGASTPSGAYENWTKEELYERAQELDIEGRSGMSKSELIKALRNAS